MKEKKQREDMEYKKEIERLQQEILKIEEENRNKQRILEQEYARGKHF